jgi:hypothetical protein
VLRYSQPLPNMDFSLTVEYLQGLLSNLIGTIRRDLQTAWSLKLEQQNSLLHLHFAHISLQALWQWLPNVQARLLQTKQRLTLRYTFRWLTFFCLLIEPVSSARLAQPICNKCVNKSPFFFTDFLNHFLF